MRKHDCYYFTHPIVIKTYKNNKELYDDIKSKNYAIERIAKFMEKEKDNVKKFLAFGVNHEPWYVIQLLNRHFPKWREAFKEP